MQHCLRRPSAGLRKSLASHLFAAVLALALLPAYAAGPTRDSSSLRNPHLASMQIEIWPEYDRSAALVILRGALAADAKLPSDITLRIPAATGGPSAMAYSAAAGGNLLNLQYDRKDASDFVTLHFQAPERYFHVEFYDKLATGKPERDYTYVWPGDFAVNRLSLVVQEPAAASDFSVQPKLDASASGQDGLRYRSGELGVREAGKQLAIKVHYTKPDARTSTDILGQKAPEPQAPAASAPAAGANNNVTKWVLLAVIAVSLLIAAGTGFLWWRGRAQTAAADAGDATTCAKCGTPRAATDRFCSNCGARLS